MHLKSYTLTSSGAAFTLAEVLITLAVIGIVAALTLPGLIQSHNEKAWSTAKDLTEKKLVEATRRMNVDGVMSGVANNTENFMEYLKRYLKIIKTCNNSELKKCYAPSMILTGKKEQNIDISALKTSGNLGQKEWNTNTMGFVMADGTTAIMAYNPSCPTVDIFSSDAQNGQLDCLALLIDVNGKKGPNKIGKDIMLENAMISDCDIALGSLGICMGGTFFQYSAISTCSNSPDKIYDDVQTSYCGENRWAAAKKKCIAQGMRLPTMAELAQIATYIYEQEENPIQSGEKRNVSPNNNRVNELNWVVKSDNTAQYYSSERLNDGWVSARRFMTRETSTNHTGIYTVNYAICVN